MLPGLRFVNIAGAGKTILTAGAIDYLFSHHQGPQVSISYFFCEFGNERSTQVQTVLRSLIKQILTVFDLLSPAMMNCLEAKFSDNHREPTVKELSQTLLSATQLAAITYLVIDGLDECHLDDRNELLTLINRLLRDSRNNIKVIISSRANVDIARFLDGFTPISLDSARNSPDIERYVCEVIDGKVEVGELKVNEPSLMDEIKVALIRGSDGM
jgi:hypothetical protein